jgi:hypothetical protein
MFLYILALCALAALGWYLAGLRLKRTLPPPSDPAPHAHGTRETL